MADVVRFAPVALGLALLVASVGSAGAVRSANAPKVSARAFAVQVAVPGQTGGSSASVSAPPDGVVTGSFAYPADGSVVSAGSVTSGAFTSPGTTSSANASSDISTVSIFGGDVTVASVAAKTTASANSRSSASGSTGSAVTGLAIQGQAIAAGAGTQFPIGDWGYVLTLQEGRASLDTTESRGARAFVTGLQVRLTADHYGLPAGTEVMIGYAEASAEVDIAAEPPPPPPHKRAPSAKPKKKKQAPTDTTRKRGPGIGAERPGLVIRPPQEVTPRLTAGGYVFPVYGPSSFGDTWGAARGTISSGWHHGEDIFGQLGAPLLAVADGTVFSVGWNNVGGYRLWLRDHEGNEFYYAHLSAFSPFAVNGREVKAGTVLGFMGNSGDAESTPYHLHFEIHPVGLLYLGYDGAVRAYPYLQAWKRLEDIEFARVAGFATPVSATSSAPKPGAILLSATDISTADGLDPGSLERALERANESRG